MAQTRGRAAIAGTVLDAATKQALPDATVTLLRVSDSSSLAFAVVDKQGRFTLKNLQPGSFFISFSFIGYQDIIKPVVISAAYPDVNIGTVYLEADARLLQGVVITAPPISIIKDTLQFKTSAFKTGLNATVEDLIRKLPGMEVDKEGNITAQGKAVQKVYVDGKEFFGNDPKIATKNLPADAVDKVQVYDKQSDQAQLTGFEDGNYEKTINLK